MQYDNETYEGDCRHGRWHGYGRATFSNGDSYEGDYRFDQCHGRGKYYWNDERVYDGAFVERARARSIGLTVPFAWGTVRHDGRWIEDNPAMPRTH